ncbi:MAG TPA: tetratricopeptide repeat protein [Caulobacteraceae bacterium]|nr:tetratricopeptide repeat protein [Caulobacteraceae bacterium]
MAQRPWRGLLALAVIALSSPAWGQQPSTQAPVVAPDLRAAMEKADAGSPADLVALADSGRADAQYYAGVMFLSGRGGVPADAPRGCAYEEKASATRADAMLMAGRCYQSGVGGKRDAARAKAAFARAAEMGLPGAKCVLGQMLMAEPKEAARGVALCKEAALAGDADAQVRVGDAYFSGGAVTADRAEARKWYDMAAKHANPEASRKLGTMYAKGEGGRRDPKRAMELWLAAEKGGDPLVPILVADQMFSDLTGGRTPGPGKYAFRGGIPVNDIEVIEDWYREAQKRDPRPDTQKRAQMALTVLAGFKKAAQAAP